MNATKLFAVIALVGLLVLTFGLPYTTSASGLGDLATLKFESGVVNKVSLMEDGTGKILVDWTKFIITGDTVIDENNGMLVAYSIVDVEAVRHHGMLLATKITVLAEAADTVKFEGGIIYTLDLANYKVKVEGTTFITNADTVLDEGLMVGDTVRVEAVRMDKKLIATRIRLLD
ncbi:MAG: hypothetical protein HY529_05780 [Chloroflexi bacterium]|nr:hypothetical protein [Chloroflexota bacterium]